MDGTNHILLGLLRRALFGDQFSFDAAEVDWAGLMKEARAQTTHLLLYDCLTKAELSNIPPEIAKQWQMMAFRTLMQNERLQREQRELLAALENENIPCVILKGSSSAMNYPKPELRCAGDIDLLVSKDSLSPAETIFSRKGYAAESGEHPCHVAMHRQQYIVELHFEPSGIPANEIGQKLRQFLNGAEKRASKEGGLSVLPPCEEAVVLLLHKLNHIVGSGMGLRQLCDWARFVARKVDAAVWSELEPLLLDFGILHFTKLVTRLCVDHLGLPKESAPWCMDADEVVAQELLEDLLRTGNFGHKERRYGQRLFTDGGKGGRIASFFRVGLRVCRNAWPVCKRYPVLTIVAPFVVLFRYCRQRCAGERPPFRVGAMFRGADQRQKLYRELRPFRNQEEAE